MPLKTTTRIIAAAATLLSLTSIPAAAQGISFRFCVECGGGLQVYGEKAYMRGPDLSIGGHPGYASRHRRSERRRAEPERRHYAPSRRDMHEIVKARRAEIARANARAAREAARRHQEMLAAQEAERALARKRSTRLAAAKAQQHESRKAQSASHPLVVKSIEADAKVAIKVSVPATTSAEASATTTATTAAAAQAGQAAKAEALLRQLMGKDYRPGQPAQVAATGAAE